MIEDSPLFAARLALALVVTTIIGIVDAGASSCKLNKIAEFPVRLDRSRLIIDGAINEHKIGIQLDTGAERSTILRAAADRLGLARQPVRGARMFGIGGETYVESAYIESFKIGETERKGWRPLVVGEQDFGADVALLLGEDFFHQIDVEFDLANNAIRLFQPQNCDGVSLAYWTREDVSEVSIGEYFPRASGMRFRYDPSRPKFDVVTGIDLGDLDRGYKAIDISGKDERLYSLTCPLMLGPIIVAIPKYTKGKLPLVPKKKNGEPLTSKVDALDDPRGGRQSWTTCAICPSRTRVTCP